MVREAWAGQQGQVGILSQHSLPFINIREKHDGTLESFVEHIPGSRNGEVVLRCLPSN